MLEDLKILCEGHMKKIDNKLTINIAHNHVKHDMTKYIEIGRHFIREKLNSELIITTYIPSGY